MPPRILLGESDFVSRREAGLLYVDKSLFVRGVLDAEYQVQLYPRPRRFGKTSNLSMLQAFYHAFILGLLVTMEKTHAVRSNREAGLGRADVQIIPKRPGQPGVVLEFKRQAGRKSLATCAREALQQIDSQKYTAELEAAGAHPIHRLGIASAGREVVVRGAG